MGRGRLEVFSLPPVTLDDLVDVGLSKNLDVASSLFNIESIEAFNDAQFVEYIDNVVLLLLLFDDEA
jgi:hypothetical protein